MTPSLRKTGIGLVGEIPWGTHFCHFFESKDDLLDAVLPFFKAGLEAKEFCLWVVEEPLTEEEASTVLRRTVPDLDRFLAEGSIEIHSVHEWYASAGATDFGSLISAWDRKLGEALRKGFPGMRVNGSAAWLKEDDWRDFNAYEERVNGWIADKPMIACCSYPLATGRATAILDVARTHRFALASRNGTWEVVETPEFREAQLAALNEELRARNRQQSALGALGLAAIRSRDLEALFDETVAVVGETLGTDLAGLGEWLPGDNSFSFTAGYGWPASVRGRILSAAETPMSAYMLRADAPVVIDDTLTDERFVSPVAIAHGVRSAVGVVVRTGSRPWGVLAAHTRNPRAFTADEVAFLQSVANVLSLAIERHAVEVAQQREKETLQAIFDNIPVMISIYDSTGRLLRVNREWERVLGWTAEEAKHIDILAETYPDPERRLEVREFVQRAEHTWMDFRPTTRDGRVIDTSWARFALSDGSRVGLGLDISVRKQAEDERARLLESERAGREQLNALSRRLLTAQEEERRRLAVELHDELGQVLTAVKINLESLARQSGTAAMPAHLRDAIVSVDQAMESVRDLALDLRPSVLDDLGLAAAVRWYADRFARSSGVEAHLSIAAIPYLPPELATACFRVAQEALTNVARHAGARNVWVDVGLAQGALELRIRDDGVGFDAVAARERAIGGASIGLLGMPERVSLVGGEYALETRPGGGTEVRARFPLGDKARSS